MSITSEVNEKTKHGFCQSCDSIFEYQPEDVWFDERGTGYSTRLVRCKHCNKIVILGYLEDNGLDVNNDSRFYE
jgi:RNase P subunit RPR2